MRWYRTARSARPATGRAAERQHRGDSIFDDRESPAVIQVLAEQLERLGRVPDARVGRRRRSCRRLGNRGFLFRDCSLALRLPLRYRLAGPSLPRPWRGLLRHSGCPSGVRSRRSCCCELAPSAGGAPTQPDE